MITVKETRFENWNCVSVSDGRVEALVTVDMGPRIISLTLNGGSNHMAVHPETRGKVSDSDRFVAYGGHRVCTRPRRTSARTFPTTKR